MICTKPGVVITITVFLFMLGVTTHDTAQAAQPVQVFVAANGNDAWSGRLATPNANKSDGPLASLPAARDVIRGLKKAGGLAGGVTVTVRLAPDPPMVILPDGITVVLLELAVTLRLPAEYSKSGSPTVNDNVPVLEFSLIV